MLKDLSKQQRTDTDDRKVDLIIHELDRYKLKVAALQETKWFCSGIYKVWESMLLTDYSERRGCGCLTEWSGN